MGTLIQTVYDTEAAELRMLGYLGYDVTTFWATMNSTIDPRGLPTCLRQPKAPERHCLRS